MLSLGSLKTGFPGLFLATVLVVATLLSARVNIAAVPRELTIFPLFLLCIFLVRSLTTDGQYLFQYHWFAPTREGVFLGLQVCWRLTLVVLISLGFIASTTSFEIKAAVEYYFSKVPFIPEKRVSTMLSLLIRFIPVIMVQLHETMDAQKSRCIDARRNPVSRLIKLTIPVMHRIFQNGDQLAIAMASRCYSEERTSPCLHSSPLDWLSLLLVSSLVIAMQLL